MTRLINTNYALKETGTPQNTPINKINMSGIRPQFKGISDDDTFEYSDENKNKKKTVLIVILSVLVAACGGLGFLAHKGGKTLGKDAKIGEKIEQGWKELFGKGKDIKNDRPDNNKPPRNNNETPETETHSNDKPKINTDPKKETVPVPGANNPPTGMYPRQTKEEILTMFEGEKRETILDEIGTLEAGGRELTFTKNGEDNTVRICRDKKIFNLMYDLATTPEEKLALTKNQEYSFTWKNYEELLQGLQLGDFQTTICQNVDRILNMFEKEQREVVKDTIKNFYNTNINLLFWKNGESYGATAAPMDFMLDNFINNLKQIDGLKEQLLSEGKSFAEIKQDLREMYEYKFEWKTYDELMNGLYEADNHISRTDYKLNTQINCPTFTEEQVEEIVNDRMKLLTELGLLSKFKRDRDKSVIYEITPTEATKKLIKDITGSIFGTAVPDEELEKIVKMYADVQQFNDFEGYKRCEKYYRERLTEKSIGNAKAGLDDLRQKLDELKELDPDLTAADLIESLKDLFTGENIEAFIKRLMGGSMLP